MEDEKKYEMEEICGEKVNSCYQCIHNGYCDLQDELEYGD